MATFGVALRSTSSSLLANAHAAQSSAAIAPAPAPAAPAPIVPLLLLACPSSLKADAVELFCSLHNIPLLRREFNPMLGAPIPSPSSSASKTSSLPILASLPRLEDGDIVLSGWITILKYLSWKFLSKNPAQAAFYPMVSAASFAAAPAAGAPPSSFVMDSFLDSLQPLLTAVESLCQTQIMAAAAAGHRGAIPYLRHRFDKDGGRLIPQWQQTHPAVKPAPTPAPASAPANTKGGSNHVNHHHPHGHHSLQHQQQQHAHQDTSRESPQFALERNVRLLRSQLGDIQAKLAAWNPTLSADKVIQFLVARNQEGSNTAAGANAAPRTSSAGDASTTPAAAADIDFLFIFGTRTPTLVDYVLFILLNELTLLRSFLPLITPATSAPLYCFCEKMASWCNASSGGSDGAAAAGKLYEILGPTSGIEQGRHLLQTRHPVLQVVSAWSYVAPKKDATNAEKDEEEAKKEESAEAFTVSVSAAAPSAAAPSSPPPAPVPQLGLGSLAIPNRAVPRLTNVSSLVNGGRSSASSLAVEEVPDLMEYVERIAVRARAATPASEHPSSSPSTPAPSTSSATSTPSSTSSNSSSSLPRKPASAPGGASTFSYSRILSQRLLDVVDAAPISWRVVSERAGVKLMAPRMEGGQGEPVSYRTMAVTMDCYKLLDPLQVMDSRELAPHPLSQKAKYSYLSLEMKSSSNANTGTRRESIDPMNATTGFNNAAATPAAAAPAPPAAAAATAAGAAGAITKVSSARFDFLLLNSWARLLDGSYVLLQQSVTDEAEVNAPKKWSKGCIRASMGGTSLSPAEPLSGWVIRPFYSGDGSSPSCLVALVSSVEFPARVGAWVAGELEKRTMQTVQALRTRLKHILGSHPLVQLGSNGGVESRGRDGTIHFRLSQAVPVSLANAVSGHGVQSTPHPKAAKG